MEGLSIGVIGVAALIVAIVQGLKSYGLSGRSIQLATFVVGGLLYGTAYGIREGLISSSSVPYIEWFVLSIAGGLAANGLYDLGTNKIPTSFRR
jgi:hypothetical protein